MIALHAATPTDATPARPGRCRHAGRRDARRRHAGLVALLLGLAVLVSGCTPFSVASDVATSGVDERTVGTMAADTRIRTEINEAWFRHDLTMFRKVGLVVHERRVLLTGIMQTRSMKDDAVRLARQIGGVREVIDEILVEDEAPGVMDLAWDNWIVTELRRKITFDSVTTRSIANYRIDAVNGTVYLIGIARDQAELDRVIDHARTLSYVRRVVSHVLLRDDPRRFRDA